MKKLLRNGQVVLITLLVLTIATTIALSLISRTTTDTSITNQIGESSIAFNAAEAGVEEELKNATGPTGVAGVIGSAGAVYNVVVTSIGGATGLYAFPKKTLEGNTETLWLLPHTNGILDETKPAYTSDIDICWSDESPIKAAIAVTLFFKSGGTYETTTYAFDSDSPRAQTNQLTAVTQGAGCGVNTGTAYVATIPLSTLAGAIPGFKPLFARIRAVYSDTTIVVNASGTALPQQGNRIESTGSTGGTNRKIVVYQQYRAASTVFDAALYSVNSVSQ